MPAADVEEAWKLAESLESIDVVVAGIPGDDGDSVFELRDKLTKQFGELPVAFCSRDDMSAYYDRVHGGAIVLIKCADNGGA